jgi:hypothetical protein
LRRVLHAGVDVVLTELETDVTGGLLATKDFVVVAAIGVDSVPIAQPTDLERMSYAKRLLLLVGVVDK